MTGIYTEVWPHQKTSSSSSTLYSRYLLWLLHGMLDVSLSDPTPPSSRAIGSCANASYIGFICPLPLTGLIISSKCSCHESALKLIQGIFYEFQLYAVQHIMGITGSWRVQRRENPWDIHKWLIPVGLVTAVVSIYTIGDLSLIMCGHICIVSFISP